MKCPPVLSVEMLFLSVAAEPVEDLSALSMSVEMENVKAASAVNELS